MKIVAVDNRREALERLTELLKSEFPGCSVVRFTDPLLSAKFICNHAVDLVLAELEMRPADGDALRSVVQKQKPELRVVVLSDEAKPPGAGPRSDRDHWAGPVTKDRLQALKKEIKKQEDKP